MRLTTAQKDALKARKERTHDTYVRRAYGLEVGEYNRILTRQNGGCAICGKKPRKRFLAVDHDHTTGRVRGLLCYFCNKALGVFEYDATTASRASKYLSDIAFDLCNPLVEANSNKPSSLQLSIGDIEC